MHETATISLPAATLSSPKGIPLAAPLACAARRPDASLPTSRRRRAHAGGQLRRLKLRGRQRRCWVQPWQQRVGCEVGLRRRLGEFNASCGLPLHLPSLFLGCPLLLELLYIVLLAKPTGIEDLEGSRWRKA